MRVQLNVKRHQLPPVKILFGIQTPCTRPYLISNLLEDVNRQVQLESEDWGLEDYVVEINGYECLHYVDAATILKDDDELVIRSIDTPEYISRNASGRYQISTSGIHLVDGIPFGKSALRQPPRPDPGIPPRKRPRLLPPPEEVLPDANTQTNGRRSEIKLTSAVDGADAEGDLYATDTFARGRRDADRSPVRAHVKRWPRRRASSVHFDEASLDQAPTFHIYEDDEDEEDDEDFVPQEDVHDNEASSYDGEDTENIEPSAPDALGIVQRQKASPLPHPPGKSTSLSEDSSSAFRSDSESESGSGSESESEPESDSDSSSDSDSDISAVSSKASSESESTSDSDSDASSSNSQDTGLPGRSRPVVTDKIRTQSAPGNGTKQTKNRNERRKWRFRLLRAIGEGILPSGSTIKDLQALSWQGCQEQMHEKTIAGQQVEPRYTSETIADIEQTLPNANVQDNADDELQYVAEQIHIIPNLDGTATPPTSTNRRTASSTATATANQTTTARALGPSTTVPEPATVDGETGFVSMDQQPFKKRKTGDAARRMIFAGLGHRTPKTNEDVEKLRSKFEPQTPRASQPMGTAPSPASLVDKPHWSTKIRLSAVECRDVEPGDDDSLPTPPFPFEQYWFLDESERPKSNKKRKRNNADHDLNADEIQAPILDYGDMNGSESLQHQSQAEDTVHTVAGNVRLDEDDEGNEDIAWPVMPTDPNICTDLSNSKTCRSDWPGEGSFIIFKQMSLGPETRWEPEISNWKMAQITSYSVDSTVRSDQITEMALRLAPQFVVAKKRRMFSGDKALYEKFEAPSDDEEERDRAVLTVQPSELIKVKLVAAA